MTTLVAPLAIVRPPVVRALLLALVVMVAGCGDRREVATASPARRIWLAGEPRCSSTVDAPGVLLRSDDDGLSWSLFSLPVVGEVTARALVFVDGTTGFAVLNQRLWRSLDGGETWNDVTEELALPTTLALRVAGVAFSGVVSGLVVGSETVHGDDGSAVVRPLLALTRNGGDTWTRPPLSLVGVPRSDSLADVCLDASGLGLAAGSNVCTAMGCGPGVPGAGNLVLASSDGGATWADVTEQIGFTPFGSTYCADSDLWLDAAFLWGLLHSSDGGETWTRQDLPVPSFQWPIRQRFDASAAPRTWFVSATSSPDERFLLTSGDSGEHWTFAPLPPLGDGEGFDAVHFSDADFGMLSASPEFCTDQLSVLFVTRDGGASWERHELAAEVIGKTFPVIAMTSRQATR